MIEVTHFSDPACPFAFSAEPVRQRLRWRYGDALAWRDVMIVLTAGDRREAELLAGGAPDLQRRHGMPIDPAPRARPASSEPACRAVIAARLFAPPGVRELLDWAGEPLATVGLLAILGGEEQALRAELARVATCLPAGADAY